MMMLTPDAVNKICSPLNLPSIDAGGEAQQEAPFRLSPGHLSGIHPRIVQSGIERRESGAWRGTNDQPRLLLLQSAPAPSAVLRLTKIPTLTRARVAHQVEASAGCHGQRILSSLPVPDAQVDAGAAEELHYSAACLGSRVSSDQTKPPDLLRWLEVVRRPFYDHVNDHLLLGIDLHALPCQGVWLRRGRRGAG